MNFHRKNFRVSRKTIYICIGRPTFRVEFLKVRLFQVSHISFGGGGGCCMNSFVFDTIPFIRGNFFFCACSISNFTVFLLFFGEFIRKGLNVVKKVDFQSVLLGGISITMCNVHYLIISYIFLLHKLFYAKVYAEARKQKKKLHQQR